MKAKSLKNPFFLCCALALFSVTSAHADSEGGPIGMFGVIGALVPAGLPAAYANSFVLQFLSTDPANTGRCPAGYLYAPLTSAAQKSMYAALMAYRFQPTGGFQVEYTYDSSANTCIVTSVIFQS